MDYCAAENAGCRAQVVEMKKTKFPADGPARVSVFGGANMDVWAQAQRPLTPCDSTPGRIECSAGGVARNVAENLSRLGLEAHLHSAVGMDTFGERLLSATQQAGVNTDAVLALESCRTATYLSLHGPDGDMAYAVNDMDILQSLTPSLLQRHEASIAAADCWVVESNFSTDALTWLMEHPKRPSVLADGVSVTKCLKLRPWLDHLHTLKVNRLEAQALSGLVINDVEQAKSAARQLRQQGVANVVVSLGAEGVCWCDATGLTGHRPAGQVQVVNTTGAGDALLAGLVWGHLAGFPLARAVEVAMACAELTLGSPLANSPDLSIEAVYSLGLSSSTV